MVVCLFLLIAAPISFASDSLDSDKPKIALIISGDALGQSNEKAGKLVRELLNERFPKNQYLLTEDAKIS
ncbi:MAG: hypothetical protein H6Q69_1095 [Firmicutes bacterium]|nr:hypothetical protein [Bacillota bacterium]